jgi:hypothetical protein
VVGPFEHGNVLLCSLKVGHLLTNRVAVSFSRRTLLHGVR